MDTSRLTAGPTGAWLHAAGLLVRFAALGFTLVLPLLGAASATSGLTSSALPGLLVAAAAYHVYLYVLNDVVDLPIDRTEPRRASSPLVRGSIRSWQALVVALVQVPVTLAVTVWLGGDARALGTLAISLVLGAVYDLWGKRARLPLLTDVVLGLAGGALALWGAAIVGGWTPLTWVVACFIVVLTVMVNGVHGGLRDLANDYRCGARTHVIAMGARPGKDSGLIVPRRLLVWAAGLQVVLTGIVLTPILMDDLGYRPVAHAVVLMAVVLMLAASGACLVGATRSLQAPHDLRSAGMLHFITTMALPIALVATRLPPLLLGVLLVAYLGPTATHRWIPGVLRWGVRAAITRSRRVAEP